jgi:hypothetical protein
MLVNFPPSEVYSIQRYVIKIFCDMQQYIGFPVNETDCQWHS